MQINDPAAAAGEPLVRLEMDRILASPEFEGADRMSDLLRYLVTQALEGRTDHLKESGIGVEVFGREAGYDTKLDPVVRVSAGRLRQRLEKFYQRAGDPPAVRIDIPKGGYVPQFQWNAAPKPAEARPDLDAAGIESQPGPRTVVIPEPAPRPRPKPWVLAALALVPLIALGVYVYVRQRPAVSLEELVREARPFTNATGSVLRPSFSPDGQTVAYDWHSPGDENRHIWLQRQDADAPVRFTSGPDYESWPVWSPDGGWIAFLRRAGTPQTSAIVLKPTLGGTERVLAQLAMFDSDNPRLDWQRSGPLLASSERDAPRTPSRIVLIDSKTGEKRLLTDPPSGTGGDSEPTFSPDGREIAFRRTVSSGVEDVFVVSVNGGEPRQVSFDKRGISGIAWRSDGKTLIVASRRAGSLRQLWEFPLGLTAQPGAVKPVRITPAAMDAGGPAVSRDGRSLVFVQSYEDKNIYAMPLGGGAAAVRLIASIAADTDPVVSPDGKSILFRSNRTGADEIWVANIDGSNERRLTRMDGPNTGGAKWSPDGARVFFNSHPLGKADLYSIAAQGGEAKVLTTPETHEVTPNASPDGKWLYFASNRTGVPEVWRQPLDAPGATPQQVTKGGGASPKLSRDGKTLYYSRNTDVPGLFQLSLTGSLPAEGARLVDLNKLLLGHWTVAESGIYFVDVKQQPLTVLKRFDFATRKVAVVCDLPGRASFYDGGLSVSQDEKTVYFTALDRLGSNLVLGSKP